MEINMRYTYVKTAFSTRRTKMGNFFTSTQIYNNEKLGKDDFILNFCKKMEEEGYVSCDSDESELSYILKFADNCKWVTVTSEAYEQGNALSHKDAGRIAKMLGTACVNTVCIDSDCAILELYDKNGKIADTFTIGRADDYFGDDIPQPSEKIWKPFLSENSSWEQFTEICSSDEVFVEDGLSKLAPIIGMDACNIIFSAEDVDVSDINAICINFRQSNVKKEKKLTLKAAFIEVFGEALEPFGYKKIKGTKPYFVRVIDNEIIQIISIFQRKGALRGEVEFEILGDVFSVYSRYFDLNKKLEDGYLLLSNFRVYSYKLHEKDYDSDIQRKLSHFKCKDDNASIISEMKNAFDTCEKWLFPFINYIDSIDEYFRFLMLWHFPLIKKELLYLKVDNYAELINEVSNIRNEMYRKCIELNRDGYTEEDYEKRIKRRAVVCSEWIADIKEIHENNGLYNEYKAEEEAVKEKNLEILKSYGLI